jgi:polyisoprenoid-binding protein YceI
MKRLTKFALIAALAGLMLVPFVRLVVTIPEAKAQGTQEKTAAKPAYLPIPGGDYRLDVAHSVIGFAILHNELALVKGRFKDFRGTIHLDDKDMTKSSVEFTAQGRKHRHWRGSARQAPAHRRLF